MARESLRLPPEILQEILSHVSEDETTLLACTLVDQDWLFESKALLFRDIAISSRETFDSFTSNVLRSERVRPWHASIHHLSLGFLDSGVKEGFILEVSERLSNLRTMEWKEFSPRCTAGLRTDLFPALGQLGHLHQLKLSFCTFPSFKDLKNVLVASPSLSVLTMVLVDWADTQADVDAELSSQSEPAPLLMHARPTLSQLSVSESYDKPWQTDELFLWLSGSSTRHAIRDFSVDLCSLLSGLEMVAGDASTVALLTTLTVRMDGSKNIFRDEAEIAKLPQLPGRMGHLEVLHIHSKFSRESFWIDIARIMRFLTSLPGPVRRLRICYCTGEIYGGERLYDSLEQLEPILDWAGAFHALEVVEFAPFFISRDKILPELYDYTSSWVQHKLPKLYKRVRMDVYPYNPSCAFGPAGFIEDISSEPNFPHRHCTFF